MAVPACRSHGMWSHDGIADWIFVCKMASSSSSIIALLLQILSVQDSRWTLPKMCLNVSRSSTCRVIVGQQEHKLNKKDKQHFVTSPPPLLLNVNNWSQQRHDSCIKVKWLWIVRWPYVITTQRKLKPDAFGRCWVWPPASCLVNREPTQRPEAKTALYFSRTAILCSGFYRWKMLVHLVLSVLCCFCLAVWIWCTLLHVLNTRATLSTQRHRVLWNWPGLYCWFSCKHGMK